MLHFLRDEHIDMMKQAVASWGCGKGRIITVDFSAGKFAGDGVDLLLSLSNNILSDPCKLDLSNTELESKCFGRLAHCLSL